MNYPYGLNVNPFPNGPTPSLRDTKIFGGKRHKDSLKSIIRCVQDISIKANEINKKPFSSSSLSEEDIFRIITLIQDVGSGKTHLSMFMKTIKEITGKAIISYIDLAQVHPRAIDTIFNAIVKGFSKDYFDSVRNTILEYIENQYPDHPKVVKKIIKYGFFDTLNGNSIEEKMQQLYDKKIQPSFDNLFGLLKKDFTEIEIHLITEMMKNGSLNYSDIQTFDNLLLILKTISSVNFKLFKKITMYQIDEFDSNSQSLEYLKGLINSHVPYSIIMLITTPSNYYDISRTNLSLFDRLEKANFKIDMVGSNSFEEINDIVQNYIVYYNPHISEKDKRDLTSKIKIIYDEFPDFRNIRSILNVLYHSMEISSKYKFTSIDEISIEETLKNVYPGLKLNGSIMGISISEFIKMRKLSTIDRNILETSVKDAINNLISYAEELGTVKKSIESISEDYIDAVYNDQYGKKIGITIAINEDKNKNFEKIVKTNKKVSLFDRFVVLTTNISHSNKSNTTFVTIDKCKLADLLYFNKKFINKEISFEDPQKAMTLARSIHLC